MTKKEWALIIFLLFLTWFIDLFSKQWALGATVPQDYGLLKIVLHKNYGAMLGLFSDLPAVLRVVSLSTLGAFLLCSYIIIQHLLPVKSMILRSGMSILIGGIMGNVTDRVLWGYVVDFIVIQQSTWSSPAFNMADVLQWIGYFAIVYALIKERDLLWPEEDMRTNRWINKKFQLKYALTLTFVGLGLALIAGVFSFTYLRIIILEIVGNNQRVLDSFLIPYTVTFSIIFLFFASLLFLLGKKLSHRAAGPIYAFERFCQNLINGDAQPLKLRNKDDFKELETIAQNLLDKYQSENSKKDQ